MNMIRNIVFISSLLLMVALLFVNHSYKGSLINQSSKLIEGGGNEPGWHFVVNGKSLEAEALQVDMDLDYGTVAWSGVLGRTWQDSYDKEFQLRGDVTQKATASTASVVKSVIVFFEKKECIDDAEKRHDWAVSVNFNSEKDYKGCAEVY
jgi:uncharacterized membrane protein